MQRLVTGAEQETQAMVTTAEDRLWVVGWGGHSQVLASCSAHPASQRLFSSWSFPEAAITPGGPGPRKVSVP